MMSSTSVCMRERGKESKKERGSREIWMIGNECVCVMGGKESGFSKAWCLRGIADG